jgi:ABC-type bacteriocin/lantibiotic exporter with double-glycine peptidase domain
MKNLKPFKNFKIVFFLFFIQNVYSNNSAMVLNNYKELIKDDYEKTTNVFLVNEKNEKANIMRIIKRCVKKKFLLPFIYEMIINQKLLVFLTIMSLFSAKTINKQNNSFPKDYFDTEFTSFIQTMPNHHVVQELKIFKENKFNDPQKTNFTHKEALFFCVQFCQMIPLDNLINILFILSKISIPGFYAIIGLIFINSLCKTFFFKIFDMEYHLKQMKKSLLNQYAKQKLYNYNFKTPLENYQIIENIVDNTIGVLKIFIKIIPKFIPFIFSIILEISNPLLFFINLGIFFIVFVDYYILYRLMKNDKLFQEYMDLYGEDLTLNSDIQQNIFGIKIFNNHNLFMKKNFLIAKKLSDKNLSIRKSYNDDLKKRLLWVPLFTLYMISLSAFIFSIFKQSLQNMDNQLLFIVIALLNLYIFIVSMLIFDDFFKIAFELAKMKFSLNNLYIYKNKNLNTQPLKLNGNIVIKNLIDDKNILNINKLEIKDGDFIGLVGPSGSGKTTLLNALYNRVKINENSVHYGVDKTMKALEQISDTQLFNNVIVLTQESTLFSDSIGFNIYFDKEISPQRLPIIFKKYKNLLSFLDKACKEYFENNKIPLNEQVIIKKNINKKNKHQKEIFDIIVKNKDFKNYLCIEILKELNLYEDFEKRSINIYIKNNYLTINHFSGLIAKMKNDISFKNEIYHILLNDIILENRGMNFSGGQRQRISLCHIIFSLLTNENFKYLLLDEPDTGMDIESSNKLYKLIIALAIEFGLTLLIVSHNLNAILNNCKKIITLERGMIQEEGSPQELLQKNGLLKRLVDNYKYYNVDGLNNNVNEIKSH